MLVSILQTLAEILVGGTSLTSTKQIDFSRPGSRQNDDVGPVLNLYFYDIRGSKQGQPFGQNECKLSQQMPTASPNWSPSWFDVSLMVTAWDRTSLGEHHLLSEALNLLLRHTSLQEEFLDPGIRGYGYLPLTVTSTPAIDLGTLWSALSIPLRPALYITVTAPFEERSAQRPLVWKQTVSLQTELQKNSNQAAIASWASVVGIVKSAVTNKPLAETKVTVMGTQKSVTSNQEGLFFFEDLHVGTYVLTLNCSGYVPENCNVLVASQTYTFKEVLLTPA